MGNLRRKMEVDEDKATSGVPVTVCLHDGTLLDFTIAMAGSNNREYVNMLTARLKPLNRKIQKGTIKNEELEEILLDIYPKTVVKGWPEGQFDKDDIFEDDDSSPLPFTQENCKTLFKKYPAVMNLVREEAEDLSNFIAEQKEDDAKKS